MYEELIKDLRNCFGTDTMFCDCDSCHYKGLVDDHDYSKCVETLGVEAADAIENLCSELHKRTVELEDATWRNIPKWIPVSERLPENTRKIIDDFSDDVLGYDGLRYFKAYYNFTHGCWIDGNEEQECSTITHWMPLPEPPKGAGNG